MRLTDDQIAYAMELHYGLQMPWKIVAREMGVSFFSLARKVRRAMNGGMQKYRSPRKRKARPVCSEASMRRAAAMQRARLAGAEYANNMEIIKSLRAEIKHLQSIMGGAR